MIRKTAFRMLCLYLSLSIILLSWCSSSVMARINQCTVSHSSGQFTFHIHVPEPSLAVSALPDPEHDRWKIQCKGCSSHTFKDQGLQDGEIRDRQRNTKESQ